MGLARLPDLFRFGLGLGSKGFESGFPTAPKKNLIRLSPLDYTGLRGEGSIPVPLPPPISDQAEFPPNMCGRRKPS